MRTASSDPRPNAEHGSFDTCRLGRQVGRVATSPEVAIEEVALDVIVFSVLQVTRLLRDRAGPTRLKGRSARRTSDRDTSYRGSLCPPEGKPIARRSPGHFVPDIPQRRAQPPSATGIRRRSSMRRSGSSPTLSPTADGTRPLIGCSGAPSSPRTYPACGGTPCEVEGPFPILRTKTGVGGASAGSLRVRTFHWPFHRLSYAA